MRSRLWGGSQLLIWGCLLRCHREDDSARSARIQSGNTVDPATRGAPSLFSVWRSGRNISDWQYIALLSFLGVSREKWSIVGSFIGLAHSYIDWFRSAGGGNICLCPSYRNIRYYMGYYPMQFLYDEPNDSRPMRSPQLELIHPHRNDQILVG